MMLTLVYVWKQHHTTSKAQDATQLPRKLILSLPGPLVPHLMPSHHWSSVPYLMP